MATVARFVITDYDGQVHYFYRFFDGYPCDSAGVFANFPLGKHDFCLRTYVRRLNLEVSKSDYFVDVLYVMDLGKKTVEMKSNFVDFPEFSGTFEEAVRRFAYDDYSEDSVWFPEKKYLDAALFPGIMDGLWDVVHAVNDNVPNLEYDLFSSRILYIGDNINFYKYRDFIYYPSDSSFAEKNDAFKNARRIGFRLFFNNHATKDTFTLLYMIDALEEGFRLPMTGAIVKYGESVDDATKSDELKLLTDYLKQEEPENLKARNFLYGLC